MWPFPLLARWQRKRHRASDRTVLFPAIRAQQRTWERGTIAILEYVTHDAAWAHDLQEWAGEPVEWPEEEP